MRCGACALIGRGLVQLDRQAVGVGQEGEAAAGELIHAYRLHRHVQGLQVRGRRSDVIHLEGEVAQAAGFGARRARGPSGRARRRPFIVVQRLKAT